MIVWCEGRTPAQEKTAQDIAFNVLYPAYPGHPWSVRVDTGLIFIKHLDFPKNWGMVLRTTEADHDAAVLKKKIILLAGEWLERAHMVRGRYEDGQITKTVEGVPDPIKPLEDNVKLVVAGDGQREEVMPQVAKES